MPFSWEAVTALISLLLLAVGGVGLYVRLTVRSALAEFKSELILALNSRYVSRDEFRIHIEDTKR